MPTHTPGSSRASGCQPFSWFLVSYRNKRLRILRVHPGRTRRINSHFHILLLSTFSAREWGGGWEYWGALSWEALGQRGQFFAYDWRFAADVARRLRLQVYTHDGVLGADHDTNPAKKAATSESERHALPAMQIGQPPKRSASNTSPRPPLSPSHTAKCQGQL